MSRRAFLVGSVSRSLGNVTALLLWRSPAPAAKHQSAIKKINCVFNHKTGSHELFSFVVHFIVDLQAGKQNFW